MIDPKHCRKNIFMNSMFFSINSFVQHLSTRLLILYNLETLKVKVISNLSKKSQVLNLDIVNFVGSSNRGN